MRFIVMAMALFFSASAFAAKVDYQLCGELGTDCTPYVLSLDFSGPFMAGSSVTSMAIIDRSFNPEKVLFFWTQADVYKTFDLRWTSSGNLVLTMKQERPVFKPVVKKTVPNGYGDTDINPRHQYWIWLDEPLVLNAVESVNSGRFEIGNETVQESCLWGVPSKLEK